MAEDEGQRPDSSEPKPEPADQLPSEPDPRLTSWLERSRDQADETERR